MNGTDGRNGKDERTLKALKRTEGKITPGLRATARQAIEDEEEDDRAARFEG